MAKNVKIGWNQFDEDTIYVILYWDHYMKLNVMLTNAPHLALANIEDGNEVQVLTKANLDNNRRWAYTARDLRPDELVELGRRDERREGCKEGSDVWLDPWDVKAHKANDVTRSEIIAASDDDDDEDEGFKW